MEPITTTKELAAACSKLAKHPFITVDTEFLRETTYFPILCVAQLASEDDAFVIDALAEGIDLAPLFKLMANERVLKVFHAARQDIEIVWHRAKIIPHPVFDTQVAAMVLGYGDSISYDQLVQQVFHAARQDIEIVWHRAKIIPHPVFDTQVAAMVLGYGDSISYDQLVQ